MFGTKTESESKSTLSRKLALLAAFLVWSAGIAFVGSGNGDWFKTEMFGEKEVVDSGSKFYPMSRFIISLAGGDLPHYLLLELSIKSSNIEMNEALHEADPLIQNTLMKMFSQKEFDELRQANHVEALQNEAMVKIVKVLTEHEFPADIEEVLFTRMVVQ